MSPENLILPSTVEYPLAQIRAHTRVTFGIQDDADLKLLIATVGLPRSGKSTWSRKLGVPMVNPDNVRLAMHGRPFIKELEEMVWWHIKLMVRSLFYAGHDTVILDSCLSSDHRRLPWATNKLWCTAFVCFPAPETVCRERAIKDNRMDLLDPIRQQAHVMSFPKAAEGGAIVTIE